MRYLIIIGLFILGCTPNNDGVTRTPSSPAAENNTWDAEAKLQELGIFLPELSTPLANYVHVVRTGNLLFLAGKGPQLPEGGYILGKVGKDLSIDEGREAARLTGIAQLAVLKAELGDLNRVKQIVKVFGMVHADSDFTQHPQVINGFSDLMVDVFGEKGKHARSAVGMNSLPLGFAVEIELIVEVED
ncbi:RidA family protein [Mongoliitalea daihaiensis]|uniref:RidA family protein n=1 Tax=Mongoliitalea daihaiensis TaxID=2782006 RepID=UPI001F2F98F8|nr:RidA family protein [Mongoliitalea daihaiensis]UJP63743.1 RidA family protein [Mongoliitalea daihaiensis]